VMQFGLVLSAQRPDCVLIGNARQEKTRTKAFRGSLVLNWIATFEPCFCLSRVEHFVRKYNP